MSMTQAELDAKILEVAEDMIADGKRARGYIKDYLHEYDLPITTTTIEMLWDLVKLPVRKHTMV